MEVNKSKITKSEAKKLYNELIQKGTDALEREKSHDIKNIISWIFSTIWTQYLLALIFFTKMYLKEQCLNEVLQRD